MFRNTVRKSCDKRKPSGYSCFDHHQVEHPAGQGTEQSAQQVNPECRGFQGKKRKKVSQKSEERIAGGMRDTTIETGHDKQAVILKSDGFWSCEPVNCKENENKRKNHCRIPSALICLHATNLTPASGEGVRARFWSGCGVLQDWDGFHHQGCVPEPHRHP